MTTRLFNCLTILPLIVSCAHSQSISIDAVKNQTSVTYRLVHPLHEIEATSHDVVFKAVVDTAKKEISTVSAQVDVTTFDSGNSNRDSHAMEVVDAISYPDVSFSSTSIAAAGDSLMVTGSLTFHGVTKNIVASVRPKWTPDSLVVQGGFNLSLTEFKIDRPSLLLIPVNDTLWFSLRARFGLR